VEGRSDRGDDGGPARQPIEAGCVHNVEKHYFASHQPSSLARARPVHHGDLGHAVDIPFPAGSGMRFEKQIHYDGAKDSEAVLEVVGNGPATAAPAEEK
jgi:hypothetical protein